MRVKGAVPEIYTVRSGVLCGGNQSFHVSPRTAALLAIAFVAFILSLGWYVYVAESASVRGKWAQAERQAAHQAVPDDYVERLMTLVLHRAGATDMP